METALTRLRQHPIMRWLLNPQRIPLLFAVTIISGIFYHYAPRFTLLWIVLSLLLIGGLFRLFDYVKQHNFIGGILYCICGLAFLLTAREFWTLGYDAPFFGPQDLNYQISFFVWFLTPQSVLQTDYPGFTIALFLLFTFFIASITYYFTLVRYRVLMSFMVMIFPFAIYAKENETMPVISIIILFMCYFTVMVYCRQAHGESNEIVQIYEPNAESRLEMPSKKSAFVGQMPEFLDRKFIRAAGIFITAATIAVLIIPKPKVAADRQMLDRMMDYSKLSDYLMSAISGFSESSDGGNYNAQSFNRRLFYTHADETLLLRVRTFTNYHYDDHTWYASDFDRQPKSDSFRSSDLNNGVYSLSRDVRPDLLIQTVQEAVRNDPEFAKKWGLEGFDTLDAAPIIKTLEVEALTSGGFVMPAPAYVTEFQSIGRSAPAYQSENGVVFRYVATTYSGNNKYNMKYLSKQYAQTEAVKRLVSSRAGESWNLFLTDLYNSVYDSADESASEIAMDALSDYVAATSYAWTVESQTTERVTALAKELTQDCMTDYAKADAIRNYLTSGEFRYSTEYVRPNDYTVETFLFRDKIGVCYDFAGAFTELARAVGLPVRNVQGYAMVEPFYLAWGDDNTFVITTDHGHAWAEVYIAGYGWMEFDATAAGGNNTNNTNNQGNVTITLQYSGFTLLGAVLIVLFIVLIVVPRVRERVFRSRYLKKRDAEAVQSAMKRLLKQWDADPTETARDICEKQAAFLGVDLSELLEGFERTVYGGKCDAETADRVFRNYCAAYDAFRAAVKREKAAKRAERRAAGKKTKIRNS